MMGLPKERAAAYTAAVFVFYTGFEAGFAHLTKLVNPVFEARMFEADAGACRQLHVTYDCCAEIRCPSHT